MAKYPDTRDVLARAALAHIDGHGVDSLTLRALGQQTGLHHTAVYKHFASRDEVLAAAIAIVLDEAVARLGSLPDDPRERLERLVLGFRSAMHAHPGVTAVYLLPTAGVADSPAVARFQQLVFEAIRDLSPREDELVLSYRLLEGYVLGVTAFDFAGAPEHLESRRLRYRQAGVRQLADVGRGRARVDALNESAFRRGLAVLLDAIADPGPRPAG